jgi:hypothetical protein
VSYFSKSNEKYFDTERNAVAKMETPAKHAKAANDGTGTFSETFLKCISRFDRKCPEYVPPAVWRQAVADLKRVR